MKKISFSFLLSVATLISCSQKKSEECYLLVGTYTSGKSEGVYVYNFNSTTGDFKQVSVAKNISNPSYLAISPDEKYVYAVNEDADKAKGGGAVTAFSFNKQDGTLKELNSQLSGGDHPCYVATDKNGKWVTVGNYTSGTVSVFPINKDGSLNAIAANIKHEGSGVNSERQEGPHVHSTVFSKDNSYLFVPDLGLDKIMIYAFNNKSGQLTLAGIPYVEVEPGAGPRHFEFSPNNKYAYLMEEMTGSISAYRYKGKGQLDLIQNISALPPDFIGTVGSADIHVSPDGKFLYASNRGESNTIAIFAINQQSGELVPV
ncbi:MAG: lactonase family protein, partial [Chitinophagaceae bacterium]|nr:lactonase family protein [Chitinophagaceae bacterium]